MLGEFTPIFKMYLFGFLESMKEIFYASLHVTATKKNTVQLIMNRSQIQFSDKKYSSQSFEFMFINWQLIAFL